jgi:hypothetical protein
MGMKGSSTGRLSVPKIVAGPFKPNNMSEEDTVDLLWSKFEDISLSGASGA